MIGVQARVRQLRGPHADWILESVDGIKLGLLVCSDESIATKFDPILFVLATHAGVGDLISFSGKSAVTINAQI